MADKVHWLLEVTVKDHQLQNLKDLIVEMADRAHANEPGTLDYMWMVSEDGSTAHVYERYKDSEAALTHLASFDQHFAQRLLTMVDPIRFTVYGSPSEALRQALAGFNPVYLPQVGGFDRGR
jgi:quinol monooxygenase YgiN